MLQEFISSKIHRATVTDANLNYVGSITIDETLMKASKIKEWQKVDILDINNGERFHTYVIKGEPDSGMICLNGAAARKVQPGDKVIIIAYGLYNPKKWMVINHKSLSWTIKTKSYNNKKEPKGSFFYL